MKRRRFLQRSASLAAIPVVAASSTGFGTPAAASGGAQLRPEDGLLRLSLARSGAPVEIQGTLERLARLWSEIDAGGTQASRFAANPEIVLREAGLATAIPPDDPIIGVWRVSMDPTLRQMASSLDYSAFLAELRKRGLIESLEASAVVRQMRDAISADFGAFVRMFEGVLRAHPQARAVIEKTDRLNALLESAGPPACDGALASPFGRVSAGSTPPIAPGGGQVHPQCTVAAAACLVYVAVGVYVYAGVVANLAVSINLGFAISVAIRFAAFITRTQPFAAAGPVSQSQRDLRRAAAVAQLLGRRDLVVETVRNAIDAQLAAVMAAAREHGMLRVPAANEAEFARQLRALAYEAVGV
jgi:hypothetical protein